MDIKSLFDLSSEVAIVTGGASGLGKNIAKVLAIAGAKVAVADLNYEGATKTVEEILNLPGACCGKYLAVEVDVAEEDAVFEMTEKVARELGDITILINCAGISSSSRIEDMTSEKWHRVVGVVLSGTYFCSRAVIPYMKKANRGKIINIGSIAGLASPKGHPGTHNYSAAKAGVLAFTKTLAVELAPYNISVNAISPGFMITPLTQKAVENKEKREAMLSSIPMGRMGVPSDLDGAVLFLASKASNYVTGHNLIVDGGYMLW